MTHPMTETPETVAALVERRSGIEMIARHRFRLDADNNCAEIDSHGLAEEIDTALATLQSENERLTRERDEALDLAQRSTRRLAETAEPGFIGAFARRDAAIAERDQFKARALAAESRVSALQAEVERLTGEVKRVQSDREYVIGWNDGWNEAAEQTLTFPTMLRKMWSGGEVQQWINQQMTEFRARAISQETNDVGE